MAPQRLTTSSGNRYSCGLKMTIPCITHRKQGYTGTGVYQEVDSLVTQFGGNHEVMRARRCTDSDPPSQFSELFEAGAGEDGRELGSMEVFFLFGHLHHGLHVLAFSPK